MYPDEKEIRRDQIDHGRRDTTLHVNRRTEGSPGPRGKERPANFAPKGPRIHKPKGHDAILAELQDGATEVRVFMISGDEHVGVIKGRDKYTITLLLTGKPDLTLYKHAIEGFGENDGKGEA
jgi:RNA chaperone Hfq